MVVDDLLDIWNIELLIQVLELSCLVVEINTIVLWSNDWDTLIVIHQEELWLPTQWHLKNDNVSYLHSDIVQLNDFVLFGKKDTVLNLPWFDTFENELHRYLFKNWVVFEHDSLFQHKVLHSVALIPDSGEYKQLIDTLLIHDQVLSWNHCQRIFILWNLHAYYLSWLSSHWFDQRNRYHVFLDLFVRVDVEEAHFVGLTYEEGVHRFNC